MSGQREQQLADDYTAAIDDLSSRLAANQEAAFDRSIKATLADLRRFYAGFTDQERASRESFDGVMRRPSDYSIRQLTVKLNDMFKRADGFMSRDELKALRDQYRDDLRQATEMGGELERELIGLSQDPEGTMKLPPATVLPEAVEEAARRASAYIEAEVSSFRDAISQTVQQGLNRGQGFRGIERQIREALEGAADPNGITRRMGMKRRAELIARSELANAYVGGQIRYATANGYNYMRWIATRAELACRLCASRHGRVYRIGDLVAPAHPKCMCVVSAVDDAAIESGDLSLLDEPHWAQSRATMEKEFAAANNLELAVAQSKLKQALRQPTPSERRRLPGIERSAEPVALPEG